MPYVPTPAHERIQHYYGDAVRTLFLATVALSFLAIPFWGHVLPFGTLFELEGGIILITLAGLVNPHSRWVMVLCAVAAGAGAFFLELAAISFRMTDSIPLLVIREAGALLLIAALYFSVKTLRAMSQGKIGEWSRPWEFEKKKEEGV